MNQAQSATERSADPVVVERITKRYGNNRGIENVSFSVAAGEIFGFLGPNGAGKSTALRCMLGFLRPDSGTITIHGRDVRHDGVESRRFLGNLPTEFSLEDRMTGREMIRLFARLRSIGSDLSHADELARRLSADLDRPMRQLSRGNKQKIGIVQAMFHRPPVLILDEPTGGLDPLVQETFLDLLGEARDAGQAIVISSHNLSEIERIADRVGIIRDGVLVAVQSPHELVGRSVRQIRIVFRHAIAPDLADRLIALPNTTDHQIAGNIAALGLHAEPNDLLQLISGYEVESLDAERPALEEIFRRYYEAGSAA